MVSVGEGVSPGKEVRVGGMSVAVGALAAVGLAGGVGVVPQAARRAIRTSQKER
jgi:hypothetical protein